METGADTVADCYTNSCRLCLSRGGRQVAVFGPASDDPALLSARISSCLFIEISQYDDLPKQICHRCECQINVWHYFKVECEESQRKLTAWLEAHPSSSSEKESYAEEYPIFQPISIKLEPEDAESPTDEHLNSMFIDGHLPESEEADSSHGHLGLAYSPDEPSDCLNLVISGTTSVDPSVHEGFGVENDNAPITKTNEIYPEPEKNFQDNLQDDLIRPAEGFFTVKSEPELGNGDECVQSDLSLNCTPFNRTSRSLSPSFQTPSSTSTINHHKRRMISLSPETNIKRPRLLKNTLKIPFTSSDLPKISNDFYDESASTCKKCDKPFSNLNNLWRHMKNYHIKENPFKCSSCRKDFCERRELIAHRLGTINKYCRLGKKPEANKSSLIIINPRIRSGTYGKYECSECKLKFSLYPTAKAHERIHSGEKPFICFICNEREFRLRKTAVKHVATCKGKNESQTRSYQEDLKPVPTVTVPKLVLHNAIHKCFTKGKSFKGSKCPRCSKGFTNATGLSNHLRTACSRKCISCTKFIPFKIFFKHFRQCFKASHSSSASSETSSDNSSNLNEDSNVVTKVEKYESHVTEESTAEASPGPRKLRRFDMSVHDMWKKQLDGDGKLTSLSCVFCGRTSVSRKSLHSHISKHSSKGFRIHSNNITIEGDTDVDLSSISNKKVSSLARPPGKFSGFKRPKLKCDICVKSFSSASSLEYHKLTHKKVKCEKCELTFPASMERTHLCTSKVKTGSVQLSENEPSILPEKRVIQYTCHLCKKKFHTRKMLYQHKKMHIKVKIFKCKMCNNSYSDAGALKAHKEGDHKDESEEILMEAKKEIQNESLGDQSSVEKSPEMFGGKPLYCHICHKGYSTDSSLDRHMKLHENVNNVFPVQKPSDPGLFYCNTCDKAFASFSGFSRHKGWHSRIPSDSSPKSDAPSVVADSPDLLKGTEPIKISSPDTKDFEPPLSFNCPLCPKKFAAQKNLRIHIHYHKNPKFQSPKETKLEPANHSETTHKCNICSSTFSDLSTFSTHMDTHTEKSFDALNTLPENDSPKQELFRCKLCNKEYKNKKNLNYHMMGHSGEKPYKCKSCSNQYSNPKALSKHEKERHAVVTHPFSCNRCKTSFLLREDLLGHQEKCPH